MNELTPFNPFAGEKAMAPAEKSPMMEVEAQRVMAEIQAMVLVAHSHPRNHADAWAKIEKDVRRPAFALTAQYLYSRGGTPIKGPTINLMATIAKHWGNLQFGWRETHREADKSAVQAWAVDWETNSKVQVDFWVNHVRDTQDGPKPILDERSKYEHVANQASRRMRSCLERLIPGDVIDSACKVADVVMEEQAKLEPGAVRKMVKAFEEAHGVSRAQIEAYIGHSLDSAMPQEVVKLRQIFVSIKDGYGKPSDYFKTVVVDEEETKKVDEAVKAAQTQPEATKEEWPKQMEEGVWADSSGEVFDPTKHAAKDGVPLVKNDGSFRAIRAKRGTRPADLAEKIGVANHTTPEETFQGLISAVEELPDGDEKNALTEALSLAFARRQQA